MKTFRSTAFASLTLLMALVWNGAAGADPAAAAADPRHAAGAAAAAHDAAGSAADAHGTAGAVSPAEWPEDTGSQHSKDSQARENSDDHEDSDDHAESADRAGAEDRSDTRAQDDGRKGHGRRHQHGNSVVNIGRNSYLPEGESADAVVSILGSSSSEGNAEDVVSIAGNTRVTGPVGDNAVAVLGDTYVDSRVSGDVVAVLGNVELGPHADVGGDVSAVGGSVTRDSAASVHGTVQSVGGVAPSFNWIRPWIKHCLLYGRPLALVSGVGWAWGLALAFLALYVCLALLFRQGVTECVNTLERQPGMALVAALLTALLTPILLVLLCITVLGIVAVPFVVFGLFCAALFGKAVMLAWVGRRCVGTHGSGALNNPAFAVLVGGVIVLTLYLVPVAGFVVYKLLGLFGFGTVVYTVIGNVRARRALPTGGPSAAAAASGAAAPSAMAAAASTPAAAAAPGTAPADSSGAGPFAATGVAPEAAPAASAVPGAALGAAPSAAPATTAPLITAALPRAGFWIRMAALLLDALLVGFLFGVLLHESHLHLLALGVYGAVMWKLRGSTIGGIVFDLQVVRLDGRAIDWQTAIVRALGCFLSLAVVGLGFFWIGFDAGKQGWHDKIAGTAVVRVPRGVPLV